VRWWWLTTLLACLPCTAQIEVKDYIGRDVVLEQPARRIVALAPHIVENLYSAGAGQYLVGAVSYSDFPAAAADVPRVGSYRAFSLETILALQPDLIITWASGNGIAALQDLQTLGVPVYVSEPRKLDDIPRSLRAYARLAGTEQVGERAAQKVSQALHALAVDYSERRPISVFYQIWHEPLQTLNGEHLVSSVIELCGGRNAFADAISLAPRINLEAVLERNPESIVASGANTERPPWLDLWRSYPTLTAVHNEALFFINPDHIQRPTARIVLGARELCGMLDSVRW
jgi:iron complex transport system substrate-binding protein